MMGSAVCWGKPDKTILQGSFGHSGTRVVRRFLELTLLCVCEASHMAWRPEHNQNMMLSCR